MYIDKADLTCFVSIHQHDIHHSYIQLSLITSLALFCSNFVNIIIVLQNKWLSTRTYVNT